MKFDSDMISALVGALVGGLFAIAGAFVSENLSHRRQDRLYWKGYKQLLQMAKIQFDLHLEHQKAIKPLLTEVVNQSVNPLDSPPVFQYLDFDLEDIVQTKSLLVNHPKACPSVLKSCLLPHFYLLQLNKFLSELYAESRQAKPNRDQLKSVATSLKNVNDALEPHLNSISGVLDKEIERVEMKMETFLNALMIFIFVERRD
jgi:hypothetical protein